MMDHNYASFLEDIKTRITSSRTQAALSVNREMILLYHHMGRQILASQQEHGWGAKVIDQLSRDLKNAFPDMKGFSPRNLKYMRKFAEEYPDVQFVQQAAAQIPWFHIATLMDRLPDPKDQMFYMTKVIEEGWSRSKMVAQIESKLHLRQGQAITNFDKTLPSSQSNLARGLLKDPYIFDFLGIGSELQKYAKDHP